MNEPKKLDQSNLFTTASTQSDSVSELTFAHQSLPVSTVRSPAS